jgi:CheY-like chemotaxis protein
VVVVEDSDEDFDTVREAVGKAGLAVELTRVPTGGECLLLLRGPTPLQPSLVLMDLNTPGTDGRETLAVIKGDPELRSYPVVVFSTSANPKDLSFCYDRGANAYHVKPVRYPDHLRLVGDLLTYWLTRVALPAA